MMRFLIDSGALLAMLDARDKYHADADTFIRAHMVCSSPYVPLYSYNEYDRLERFKR